MNLKTVPQRLTGILVVVVASLVAAHVSLQMCRIRYGLGLHGWVAFFDLGNERSVPTIYSALALLFSAYLLAVIARSRRGLPYAYHWWALSVVFVYLSLDEALAFHERLGAPISALFHASSPVFYAWVIPYAGLVALVALVFWRFALHLPARTRLLVFIAGLTFIAGALGLELAPGLGAAMVTVDSPAQEDVITVLLIAAEEAMEMMGVVIFIHALTGYLRSEPAQVGTGLSSRQD